MIRSPKVASKVSVGQEGGLVAGIATPMVVAGQFTRMNVVRKN